MVKKNLLVILAKADQAKQLFSSVYWNAGWKGDYMLLAHEIPEKKLKWFRDKGILVKKCKLIPNSEKSKAGKWPPLVFDKFYLFKPEFKKWKNIIFIEADMIVRASLEDLTKVKGFAAVKGWSHLSKLFMSPLSTKVRGINNQVLKKLKKNYNLKETAFNSGVMIFNTDIIKKDTFSKLKQLLNQYIEITAAMDESIFNLYFYKKWQDLPVVYNIDPYTFINFKKMNPKKIDGIILHFRKIKPWDLKNPFYKEWKSNLDRAELINLKKIRPYKRWNEREIQEYELYLKKKHSNFNNIIWKASIFIDEYIGLLGVFLKKHHPKLYFRINSLKKK